LWNLSSGVPLIAEQEDKVVLVLRLLMRRDQVLKLCLNHFLKPELVFREKDEKTWLWIAPDYSEGHVQEEKFALRFKNKEIATEFKQAIDKAQVSKLYFK
jgi:E3 SUMO-protein ligase RanBP2